jgi:dienelactone hydrolase
VIEAVRYQAGALACEAYVARPVAPAPHPAVLIAPTIRGPSDLERHVATRLAGLGYVAAVIDVYGADKRDMAPEDARAQMNALLADRALLRERLGAALAFVRGLDGVDTARVAAIGYCFGGLCALDIARTGTDEVAGVSSLHGIFAPPGLGPQPPIGAKILVLHGWADPLAKPDEVLSLAAELDAAGADWQLHAYGHVGHAFTNPAANAPGLAYNAAADRRSFAALSYFLAELFA